MKRLVMVLGGLLLAEAFAGIACAEFKGGYKVVDTTAEQVMIKTEKGEEISVADTSGKYKIGDKVKYDEKEKKIMPEQVSCICSGE